MTHEGPGPFAAEITTKVLQPCTVTLFNYKMISGRCSTNGTFPEVCQVFDALIF